MTNNTANKYSRIAKIYDLLEAPIETSLFSKLRKAVVSRASGKTLEVGIGTGKNLPYYNDDINLVGIDFSKGMLEKARSKKIDSGPKDIDLLEMDVQYLKFENDSFDTVISTFVFCTVPDPIAGLKEVKRVLKPNGKAIFLEHMKSNNALINIMLYMMNIFSKRILGTYMLRETQNNIESSGLIILSVENKLSDVVRLITATKL